MLNNIVCTMFRIKRIQFNSIKQIMILNKVDRIKEMYVYGQIERETNNNKSEWREEWQRANGPDFQSIGIYEAKYT